MKILAVDDSKTMLAILDSALRDMGYRDIVALSSAEEAWNLVAAEQFSLIISDWHMNMMTGLDLLIRVRSGGPNCTTPFLLLTSEQHKKNIIDAVKHGVSGYLYKPLKIEALRQKLFELCSEHNFMPPAQA